VKFVHIKQEKTKLTWSYLSLLLFFVPIYVVKAFGLGTSNRIALIVTVFSVISSLFVLWNFQIRKSELYVWILLIMLALIITFTSGKYGIFLSIYSMFILRNFQFEKIWKVLFFIGVLSVTILVFFNIGNSSLQIRFVDGEWTSITKRSNFIYVSFFAVFNYYLLWQGDKFKNKELIPFGIIGVALFLFSFSRSGAICFFVEVILIIVFKFRFLKKKIVKNIIILLPLIVFSATYIANYFYGKIPILAYLNSLLQNRLRHGKFFLDTYPLTLFGQKIITSSDVANYQILDNTCLNLVTNYGLIITILWLYINIFSLSYLYKKQRYNEIAMLIAYLLYSVTESFVIISFINPSFFIYTEYIREKTKSKKENALMESINNTTSS